MPACGDRGFVLGCDFSVRLVGICRERGEEALAADNLHLPYRSGCFHAVLSIAVLHHISTEARRIRAIAETMRVVQLGGRGLFYAWAREQKDARSGHAFEGSDVFVPWHLRYRTDRRIACQKPEDVLEGATASHGVVDEAKGAVVFQRYCHVYEEGELQELFARLPWVEVTESYYDTGNWCVAAKKISEPPV
jgi:alkylated DNA repair protein alkB family protein 8